MAAIRFIVDTVSSKPDANGNTYHLAYLTSVKSGRSVAFHSGGPVNAAWRVRDAIGGRHSSVHRTHCVIGKKRWKEQAAGIRLGEHEVSAAMLIALEVG